MKLKFNDNTILILATFNALVLIISKGVVFAEDSESYINAWQDSLSQGYIDFTRTPTYPLILGALKAIAGPRLSQLCIILQYMVFLISVWVFRKITLQILPSVSIGRWLTLIYALLPLTCNWASSILTESFAISVSVFLFYHLLKFFYAPSLGHVLWGALWLTFLIFLRPAFLYLLPVCLIVSAMYWRLSPKLSLSSLIGVLTVSLLEYSYCSIYEERFGIFAPSNVSTVNFTYLAFRDGLMKPEYTNNVAFQTFIEQYDNSEPISYCPFPTIEEYGLKTVAHAVHNSQQDQTIKWIRNALGRFGEATQFFHHSFVILYIFLIFFTFNLLWHALICRQFYPIPTLLLIATLGNLFTAIIGAQGEWLRLITPSFPLLILMIGFFLPPFEQGSPSFTFFRKIKKTKDKNMKRSLFIALFAVSAILLNAQTALKKVYNEDINPIEQIDQALAKAKAENKNVICQVGGNWCPWCLRFADFISRDSTISQVIDQNFVYIHVNYNPRKVDDEAQAQLTKDMLQRLNNPVRFGFPVFVVLDENGKVIHTQDSSFLEEGNGYNKEKVLRFFNCWTPQATL